MHIRDSVKILALTAVVAVVAPGALSAAVGEFSPPRPKPKPSCFLLVDAAGDTRLGSLAPVESRSLDILSGDIGVGATTLVGVLRVRDFSGTDIASISGEWVLRFRSIEAGYALRYLIQPGQFPSATLQRGSEPPRPVQASLDPLRREVRWTASRSYLPELADLEVTRFFDFSATTTSPALGARLVADTAFSMRTYDENQPSCVKPS